MSKVGKDKLKLLRQALSSASSSIKLANQLLNEIEQMGGSSALPGLVGEYDGHFMTTEAGKKYPVPDNYAAKTKLVYGDKLKMIETPKGRQFKVIEKIPRVEKEAQLVVKDGQFEALGKDSSYKLIQSAVKYYNGEEGDGIKILLPEKKKNVPFACLVSVGKKEGKEEKKKDDTEEKSSKSKESGSKSSKKKKENKEKEKKKEDKKTKTKKGSSSKSKKKEKSSKEKNEKKSGKSSTSSKKTKEKKEKKSKSDSSPKSQDSVLGEEELR